LLLQVAEQRKQYRLLLDNRKSAITPYRIKLLDELDFVWNAQEEAWRRQMKLLRKFHSEYGHCNVQIHNPDYPKLGLWVKEQRRHYMLMKQGRTSHMTLDRFRQLSELDFCYDTHESTWQQRLSELEEFKRVNGNCVVSSSNANAKLAVWVHHQRRQYKKMLLGLPSHMSQERMKALNDIDFVWFPRKKPGNLDRDAFDSDDNDADDSSTYPKSDDSASDEGDTVIVSCPPAKRRKS
jgi:Helicase associated domain